MKRAVLLLLCGAGLSLAGVQARADFDEIQIANLTASSGVLNVPYTSTDFPVATALTLTNLQLTKTFADSTIITDTLYDAINIAQTSLGSPLSGSFILTGAPFSTSAHGGLLSETLRFTLGTDTIDVYTVPLPGTATTSVSGVSGTYFESRSLTTTGQSSDLVIFNNSPQLYNIGTISLVAADVPEPGAVCLLVAAGSGLVSLLSLRRRARRA